MAGPQGHALLSPSAAERWLHCTRAPRLEATLPETPSPYAAEGTLAHRLAEIKVRRQYGLITRGEYDQVLAWVKEQPEYQPEMGRHTDDYLDYINQRVMGYDHRPHVAVEVPLDLNAWVPESFGTADCVIIGGDTIEVIDLKYGKGVAVDAEGNPQARLYALGAWAKYQPLFGDHIQTARTVIYQPRLDHTTVESLGLRELLAWGNAIRPTAKQAYNGMGVFAPGDWCRFCRAKATCRARGEQYGALADFAGMALDTYTDDELGALLTRAKDLAAWANDLQEYALAAALEGRPLPGWKAVEGRSTRAWRDQDAAFEALRQQGYDDALLYERRPLTLAAVEKLVGKKAFADQMAAYVTRPRGKPTLVPDTDKRPPYNSAAHDFSGVGT